jgi:GPH family glycoside/pentoside/hexuronide:cation symporter
MFIGAILSSVTMVAFFHVPQLGSPGLRALYMGIIITMGFGAYSLFSVPYLTMASEIVTGVAERSKMMSFRVVFMAIGLTVGAFAGGVIEFGGGGLAGYSFMSWTFAAICLTTMLTTVFSTGFARHNERAGEHLGIADQVRLVFGNERYRLLWIVGFMQKLGEGVGYGSFAFFCIYVVEKPLDSLALVVLSATVGQTLAQPFWLWAAKRWSRPTLYTWGVAGWCVNVVAWLLMKGISSWWLIPLGLESGVAAGGFLMITLSMLSNVLTEDTERTGRNQEGIYSGFWLAGEKVAFALGALIVGIMLQLFGFVESTGGTHGTQTPTAILGIGLTYCGVNVLIYVLSVIPVWRYRRFETAPQR